jgi:hypothetical protein
MNLSFLATDFAVAKFSLRKSHKKIDAKARCFGRLVIISENFHLMVKILAIFPFTITQTYHYFQHTPKAKITQISA